MAVVFDCSVTLAWFLKDERTAFTDTAFELTETAECWVPFLWRLEFPNALLFAERKKRDRARAAPGDPRQRGPASPAHRRHAGGHALAQRPRRAARPDGVRRFLPRARLRLGGDLITLDRDLADAALAEGVTVHSPGRSTAAQVRRRYAAQAA